MDARTRDGLHMMRLDRDEDVLSTLAAYMEQSAVRSGIVWGIGAVKDVTIGAFVSGNGQYVKTDLGGEWELLSFNGTVSMLDGRPFVHPHVVLGDAQGNVRGGHLFGAKVAVTGEFVILPARIGVSREPDLDTGLRLWRFVDTDSDQGRDAR